MRRSLALPLFASLSFVPRASAQDAIAIDTVELDPPTVSALGVRVLVSGDADRDATATLRVREIGGEWCDGLPMLRVHPDAVSGTESDPIVIRGPSTEEVVLDGGGCDGCNAGVPDRDAGVARDASTPADAAHADGGVVDVSGGCGCRASGRSPSAWPLAALFLLALHRRTRQKGGLRS